jgi:hypothetical protein
LETISIRWALLVTWISQKLVIEASGISDRSFRIIDRSFYYLV